jgi:CheY-like chemotaxis protein
LEELSLRGEASDSSARLDGLRLLVVDNEPDTLVTLEVALRALGADVIPLLSPLQVDSALSEGHFDAFLSDVNMPELDGIELIRSQRARERVRGGHLPSVALTALASVRNSDECLAAGFDAHLAKPCDIQVLARAIQEVRRKNGRVTV